MRRRRSTNQRARQLAADAMEQLAYQSESSTWRNAYALGAKELRFGAPKPPPGGAGIVTPKVVAMMPMGMFFDFLAMRVNAEKAEGLHLRIAQTLAVQHHGERVAQKGGVGEDVDLLEGACFHGEVLRDGQSDSRIASASAAMPVLIWSTVAVTNDRRRVLSLASPA